MKKIKLGQVVSILANVGVILGLMFLAYELRQNNQLIEAQQRDSRNSRVLYLNEVIIESPGLAEIISKSGRGEPISEVDSVRLSNFQMRLVRGIEAR